MNAINRNGQILKNSLKVLADSKRLIIIPILFAGIPFTAFVIGLFSIAYHWKSSSVFYNAGSLILLAAVYFLLMFLVVFSHVALYNEIIQALNGNQTSLKRGLKAAAGKTKTILKWSFFCALGGLILSKISSDDTPTGRIVSSIAGTFWALGCIFVIPSIIRETKPIGPFKLLRRSAMIIKNFWGESISGFIGMGLIAGLPALLITPGVFFLVNHRLYLFAAVVLAMVVLLMLLNLIKHVFIAALYVYATEGVIPGDFNKELMDSAWKIK